MNTYLPRFPAPVALLALALLVSACGRNNPDELITSAEGYLAQKDAPAAIIQLKNALQANPDSARARFLLGQALLATGDAVGAETEFKKAQELGLPPDEVLPRLAQALLQQGQYRKLTTEYAGSQLTQAQAQAGLKTALAIAWKRQGQEDKFKATLEEALKAQADYAPALMELARTQAVQGDPEGALALLDKVPATSPVADEALKLRGDVLLFGKNDPNAALALYQEALKVNPRYVEGQAATVQLLLGQGKNDAAATALQALEKSAPGHPKTLYLQAKLAYAKNDLKATQKYTQEVLRLTPDNALALELAGLTELRLNAYVQAEAFLGKALQLAPNLTMARRGLVLTYARQGRFDKAMATLAPGLEKNDRDSVMLTLAGQIYLLQGDTERAQSYFKKASGLDPRDPVKRTSLAVSRLMSGQTEDALDELHDIATSDDGVVADMALVNALLQKRDVTRALEAIAALEKKRPADIRAPFLRGRALLLKDDAAGARKAMERVLEIDPNYFPAVEILAQLDNAEKRPDEARARIEAAIKQRPNNVQAHLALVNLRAANGADKTELMGLLRKAVEAVPDSPTPRLLLAEFHLRNNAPKEALAVAQQAVTAVPDNVELLDVLGRAQSASGEHNQALSTFSRVAALQPQSPQPFLRMASAHQAAGNNAAAEQSLRKALEITPNLLPAQQGLAALAMVAKKPGDALAIARNVQKQRPKETAGYLLEGDIYTAGKDWDKAVEAFRAGLKQVSNPDLAVRLHGALLAAGKKPEAARWAAEWLRSQPKDAVFPFYLGGLAMNGNDLAEGLRLFERVLALHPNNAIALNNAAWIKGELGRDGALSDAERANVLAPNQPPLMDTWAMLLSAANQHEKAVEIQKKALQLQPQALGLKLNLAKIYAKAGQKDAARVLLDELSAAGARFPAQAEVEQLKKSL